MVMAERNYLSSSQESLPLSEESCMYILNELGGSSLYNLIDDVSSLYRTTNEDYSSVRLENPAVMEPEGSVTEYVANMCQTALMKFKEENMVKDVPQEPIKAPSSLPATENWPGDSNFNVTFITQENVKGAQWLHSEVRNKLYVRKDAPCPINFSTSTAMTDDVVIRAMPLFSAADQASEVVHRCVNHSIPEIQLKLPEAEHLVRCESSNAVYITDPVTGRHSVVVPFENPGVGQQFSCYIYKFMCFGSCAGGPNRRPLMLVFTLEKGGSVIGRQKVDVKICACPSRDMKADEKVQNSTKRKVNIAESDFGLTPDTVQPEIVPNFHSAVKRMRPSSGKKGQYSVHTEDESCYMFLKIMKKSFILLRNSKNRKPIHNDKLLNIFKCFSSSSEDEK